MTTFVLVHSPLVGPATWSALIPELRARGVEAIAPDLRSPEPGASVFWKFHARSVAAAIHMLPLGDPLVLVGHSAAGALLPAIREISARPVSAYLFVDAGLPDGSRSRKGTGGFAERLAELHAGGHRFPEWTDRDLREVIPDDERRCALLAEVRPAPPAFWEEVVPVFVGWPDAPCGYLRFAPNPSYDDAAAEARARGWPCREMPGGHFHMLVDPQEVADALVALAGVVRGAPAK